MLSTNVPNQQDASRISFQDHSYFSPQPDLGHVDVFYFRAIMHNNNDTMVIRIIENLLPAMKKGTRILIEDMVLPPANTIPRFLEKLLR